MINNTPKTNLLLEIYNKNQSAVDKKEKNIFNIAKSLSEEIKNIIKEKKLCGTLNYEAGTYWKERGKFEEVAFVDGGSKTTSPSPYDRILMIQSGHYLTNPSKKKFNKNMSLSFVDEVFDKSQIFDDEEGFKTKELSIKMMTAARIIIEMATVIKLINDEKKLNKIFLHGPLQNRAVYFAEGVLSDYMLLPPFKEKKIKEILPFLKEYTNLSERQRSFVNIYRKCQEYIKKSNKNVYGIVEKKSAAIYVKDLLKESFEDKIISEKDLKKLIEIIDQNQFTDNNILDLILEPNQFLNSREINKQKLKKDERATYPEDIISYPKIFVGYIKFNEADPVRIESFKQPDKNDLDYILHCSRLLPNYGFPVGLQIIDNFVKVPSIMNTIVMKRRMQYLKKAILEEDDKKINYLAKMFGHKQRNFFNRPK